MKAVVQERWGAPDSLRLAEVAELVPGEGEVLVRVRAAGLNPADWHLLRGSPVLARPGMGWTRPRNRIAGTDGAGVVERLGPGVGGVGRGDGGGAGDLAVGNEVYGFLRGSFAEFAIAPVEKLAPKPEALSFVEAAALPIAATTAQRGIRDVAKVRAGQSVLITGASGGVGHFAVQVAVGLGAEVTGVCSAANAELVRELGATHVIDYRTTDFAAGSQRYDVILDNAGVRSPGEVRRALTPDGTLIMNDGGRPGGFFGPLGPMARGLLTNRFVRPTITTLPVRERRDELLDLNQLIAAGTLRPVVSRTWTLAEAGRALAELEQGHTRGKAVLEIA